MGTLGTAGTTTLAVNPHLKTIFGYAPDAAESLVQPFDASRFVDPQARRDLIEILNVPEEKMNRLARTYKRGVDRKFVEDQPLIETWPKEGRGIEAGGAGLFSTAGDFARFAQMLCNGGTLDGKRILGRKTVLLLETHGRNLAPTAQCLRENGFYVSTAQSERAAVELLHSPDYQFDAIMALVNGKNRLSPRLFNEIARLKLPMKKIVQIYGLNQDEHDSALLERADLVIGSDTPAVEIAGKLLEALSRLSA